MSVNAKLSQLSLELHSASQQSSPNLKQKSTKAGSQPVVDSWEDESLSDSEQKSPASESSDPVEAPGPDIKSPTTRAIDAEKELAGDLPDDMPIPPPTPISPQNTNIKQDWSPAMALGGGRPTYTSISAYSTSSNPSSNSARSTPTGTLTPTHRYPTPNPPVDSTSRDRDTTDRDRKRPEKTTATANRLIAGALGIKVAPKTDEQRRYDRAVKEQEIKRRNREREERKLAEEEDERVKAAVWDS